MGSELSSWHHLCVHPSLLTVDVFMALAPDPVGRSPCPWEASWDLQTPAPRVFGVDPGGGQAVLDPGPCPMDTTALLQWRVALFERGALATDPGTEVARGQGQRSMVQVRTWR